jgi:hypothetical protein
LVRGVQADNHVDTIAIEDRFVERLLNCSQLAHPVCIVDFFLLCFAFTKSEDSTVVERGDQLIQILGINRQLRHIPFSIPYVG